MNRLHFDNIEIAPISLKHAYINPEIEIEIIDYNPRFTDFKPNRLESKSKQSRIDSNRFSVPISQSRPCLVSVCCKLPESYFSTVLYFQNNNNCC